MSRAEPQVGALRALGYTQQESRFLCLAATHSGYFTLAQFLGFVGAYPGKRAACFLRKLKARRHAHTYRLAESATAYRLSSESLYRQMYLEPLRNHHEHEFAYVRTRIAILDFVLGNLENRYLETEQDKVAYFSSERNVPREDLPSK